MVASKDICLALSGAVPAGPAGEDKARTFSGQPYYQ